MCKCLVVRLYFAVGNQTQEPKRPKPDSSKQQEQGRTLKNKRSDKSQDGTQAENFSKFHNKSPLLYPVGVRFWWIGAPAQGSDRAGQGVNIRQFLRVLNLCRLFLLQSGADNLQ